MSEYEVVIDEAGRVLLPPELRERLGWKAGAVLSATVVGDGVRLSRRQAPAAGPAGGAPVSPTATLKEQARRLADAMRGIADTKEVRGVLASLGLAPSPSAPEAAPVAGSATEREPMPPSSAAAAWVGPRGALRSHAGHTPRVPASCYVDPAATLIGEVVLGEECSVWPGAVLRGDAGAIQLGARVNVQDGAVLHGHPERGPTVVGDEVTIGHGAVVHSSVVERRALIGIHAVILDGARVGEGSIIGAGAIVPPGMEIPPGQLVLGVPARIVRPVTPEERREIAWHAAAYVALAGRYRSEGADRQPGAVPPLRPAQAPSGISSLAAVPTYPCRRAPGPIRIDGSLDESAWSRAAAVHLALSSDGEEPRLGTEARLCWDERALYVAFSCKDTDIWGTLTQRDQPLYEEEVVEVFLCPTGDLRHYFEFEVSPRNVLFDARIFSPEGDRRSMLVEHEWDAPGLESAVRVAGTLENRDDVDLGWIAEIAIPFADLGLAGPPAPGDRWRINLYRIERGEVEEYTAWSPTFRIPADFHVPARFGWLEFVEE